MLAVDTNVVVRFLTHDDARQAAAAGALFRNEKLYVSKTVLLETEWVLRSVYEFDEPLIRRALTALLALANVEVEDARTVLAALRLYAEGMDLADSLHLSGASAAQAFVTFDTRLVRKAERAGVTHVRTVSSPR